MIIHYLNIDYNTYSFKKRAIPKSMKKGVQALSTKKVEQTFLVESQTKRMILTINLSNSLNDYHSVHPFN